MRGRGNTPRVLNNNMPRNVWGECAGRERESNLVSKDSVWAERAKTWGASLHENIS